MLAWMPEITINCWKLYRPREGTRNTPTKLSPAVLLSGTCGIISPDAHRKTWDSPTTAGVAIRRLPPGVTLDLHLSESSLGALEPPSHGLSVVDSNGRCTAVGFLASSAMFISCARRIRKRRPSLSKGILAVLLIQELRVQDTRQMGSVCPSQGWLTRRHSVRGISEGSHIRNSRL